MKPAVVTLKREFRFFYASGSADISVINLTWQTCEVLYHSSSIHLKMRVSDNLFSGSVTRKSHVILFSARIFWVTLSPTVLLSDAHSTEHRNES